jgi:hypothetical protein
MAPPAVFRAGETCIGALPFVTAAGKLLTQSSRVSDEVAEEGEASRRQRT